MIDLHSHFLPAFDDGAKDAVESIAMLSESKKQGVELCVGTSHIVVHRESTIESFLEKRKNRIELLESNLKGISNLPKRIYGAEIFLDNDISQYENISKLCIGDTNCLLVELSPGGYLPSYTEWIYSLTLKGFLPIIAHIERYPYIERFFEELQGVKVVYQMNARTMLKRSGRKQLLSLYDGGQKIIVASDMHNMGVRKTRMKDARAKVGKYGLEIAEDVFVNTQKKILNITDI